MRRRNLQYKAEVVGVGVPVVGDDLVDEDNFNNSIEGMGLTDRLNDVTGVTSIAARSELVALLGSPKVSASKLLVEAALEEVESEREEATDDRVGRVSVLKAAEKFADPKFGEGLARLMTIWPELSDDERVMEVMARSRAVPELDRLAQNLDDKTLEALVDELKRLVAQGNPVAIADFVRNAAERLKDRPT